MNNGNHQVKAKIAKKAKVTILFLDLQFWLTCYFAAGKKRLLGDSVFLSTLSFEVTWSRCYLAEHFVSESTCATLNIEPCWGENLMAGLWCRTGLSRERQSVFTSPTDQWTPLSSSVISVHYQTNWFNMWKTRLKISPKVSQTVLFHQHKYPLGPTMPFSVF